MSGLQLPGLIGPALSELKRFIEFTYNVDLLKRASTQTELDAKNEFIHTAFFKHKYSMTAIAKELGYADHSTVSYYLNHKFYQR